MNKYLSSFFSLSELCKNNRGAGACNINCPMLDKTQQIFVNNGIRYRCMIGEPHQWTMPDNFIKDVQDLKIVKYEIMII